MLIWHSVHTLRKQECQIFLVVFLQRTLLRQIIPVRVHGIVIPHDIQISDKPSAISDTSL